ncbi:hypothetical protein RQP46_009314 [Phenoliferia psychrophenolica]
MPPARRPNSAQGGQNPPQTQLNPAEIAQFQAFIRQRQAQTGGTEVTAAMVQEWMATRTPVGGGQQQMGQQQQQPQQMDQMEMQRRQMLQRQEQQQREQAQQQQQQQQLLHHQQQQQHHPQQAQHNQQQLDTVIAHLFPAHLASNPQAAVAHLQNVLFPASSTGVGAAQSPLLQQVMQLAQGHRLNGEQMGHLKSAVATRPNLNQQQAPPPPQQQQQQQYAQQQQQHHPQQQQLHPQQQQQQQHHPQHSPQPPPHQPLQQQPGPATQLQANAAIHALQSRIQGLEGLLARSDINDDQRAKASGELESARANLQRVVQGFLQQKQQLQQAQAQAQQAGGGGVDHQAAQRLAMQQHQSAVARAAGTGQAPYRTASPAGGSQFTQPSLAHPPPPGSSSSGGGLSHAPSPANSSSLVDSKKLTKKQQQTLAAETALAASQSQQQAALAASQQLSQSQKPGGGGSNTPKPNSNQNSNYIPQPAAAAPLIPANLSMPSPHPESFPAPRPTLSSGLANAPVVSSPAISAHPGLGQQQVAEALARPKAKEKEKREDNSQGRTVSKRKIRELVESVDPEERLTDEVEELLLSVADEFIDSITRFGCQLAKHRKSDRLEVKDLALHLDRNYNIKIPGFGPEETRPSQNRRAIIPPGYQGRIAAVRESKRR